MKKELDSETKKVVKRRLIMGGGNRSNRYRSGSNYLL